MFWLWLYIAAMFLIALPVAWFGRSRGAGPIFVVWYVGQIAYEFGLPEPETQTILYSAALIRAGVYCWLDRWSWSGRDKWASGGFLPLALISAFIPSQDAWWPIYWCAWAQLITAIRPREWLSAAMDTRRAVAHTWALLRNHRVRPQLEPGAV